MKQNKNISYTVFKLRACPDKKVGTEKIIRKIVCWKGPVLKIFCGFEGTPKIRENIMALEAPHGGALN